MQGTKERSQSSPSTGTNGRPTATETLMQTGSNKAQHSECDQNKTAEKQDKIIKVIGLEETLEGIIGKIVERV